MTQPRRKTAKQLAAEMMAQFPTVHAQVIQEDQETRAIRAGHKHLAWFLLAMILFWPILLLAAACVRGCELTTAADSTILITETIDDE